MVLTIFWHTIITILAIIVLTRIHGVRSFSKMSGFDFAITVAVGSVLAGAITAPDKTIIIPLLALISLFAVQVTIAQSRARNWLKGVLDNDPILVMDGSTILDDNLKSAGMTRDDLYGKLREANAFDLNRILAVVAESTGDVSVLHATTDDASLDDRLLQGVRRT